MKVYGRLVSLGGINIAQFIEFNVTQCMQNLSKTDKKYTSLLVLVELLRNVQFITFNRIRRFDYISIFKSIIPERKQYMRSIGLEFIDECIKETSKRASNPDT